MKPILLIAEDDRELQELYTLMLGDRFEIVLAQNGQEAIDLYRDRRPALVMMDIQMPVLSGDAAIRAIQADDPGARILVVTAYRFTAEDLGAPVLRKSFSLKELLAAIDAVLAT